MLLVEVFNPLAHCLSCLVALACCLASVLFDVGLVKSQRSQRAEMAVRRAPCSVFHVQPCLLMNSWALSLLAAYFALSYFHFQ